MWNIIAGFYSRDKSKVHAISLLGNQSLLSSITQCAWGWLTPQTVTSGIKVSEQSRSPLLTYFLSSQIFFIWLYLICCLSVGCSELWIPARPAVVLRMLVCGLVTCWGLLCLYRAAKYCTHTVVATNVKERHSQRQRNQMSDGGVLWLFFIQRCGSG